MLQHNSKVSNSKSNNKETSNPGEQAIIFRIPPPIPPRLSKKVLEKSKFYKKIMNSSSTTPQTNQLYAQASKSNIKNIIKIKENFLNLSAKKVEEIYKVFNKPKKKKPRLNMIIEEPLRKQVIVTMSLVNLERFIVLSNKHVSNINRSLKEIKSDIMADFI